MISKKEFNKQWRIKNNDKIKQYYVQNKEENHHHFVLHDETLKLNISTKQELIQYVEQINITALQGIILINSSTLECIKVINNNYWYYYTLLFH